MTAEAAGAAGVMQSSTLLRRASNLDMFARIMSNFSSADFGWGGSVAITLGVEAAIGGCAAAEAAGCWITAWIGVWAGTWILARGARFTDLILGSGFLDFLWPARG